MISWRADKNGRYWFIGTDITAYPESDAYDEIDERRYEAGNYFSTRTEAVKTAQWMYAGIAYIRGSHMEAALERLLEARRLTEKVDSLRREP